MKKPWRLVLQHVANFARQAPCKMKTPWWVPTIICLALLIAWPFRWEKGPEHLLNYQRSLYAVPEGPVGKQYVRDRWTGDWWQIVYSYSYAERYVGSYPVNSAARDRRNLATGVWAVLVVASGVWAWRIYVKGK